jgi:Sigma-70 factor, region 1.1
VPTKWITVCEKRASRLYWSHVWVLVARRRWLGTGGLDAERLERLVEDGFENGFLSYDEIANAFEDLELTREQSEEVRGSSRTRLTE